MSDASGFGFRIRLIASQTFPSGIDLTQFADDSDPFDVPSIQIKDKAMGLNGDMITWNKANPIPISIAMLTGTEDDKNMAVLLEANRSGKGKRSVNDVITMTGIYPDGSSITLTPGAITDGMVGKGIASAGRLKTNVYQFAFENRTVN